MSANSTACADQGPPKQGWKDKGPYTMPKWEVDEDVVISGFSGRYPESNSVEELKTNLFEKVDMVTENDRRWKPGLFGTPKRMGKLKEIDKFDMFFFGVHGKQADMMDPMHRLILEATYEAFFDAGYEPNSFRGKKVGVFVGCSERSVSGDAVSEDLLTGYELLGMSTAMIANRISFIFGLTGPSMTVDTACSSTMHALNEAVIAIRNNRCDAAIVGGGTINLSVNQAISFTRLGLVSPEGTCKVFDNTANGYVRSEAVGAIFIQRASDARRCYATVLHCKLNNDGAKPEGISFPSAALQKQLLREVFSELDMDPKQIDYVEAHGTGTMAGDREESNAIAEFFCKGRNTPLLVGSVKSNLGHAEAASGTCTIAKVLLSMEEDNIAPNIHYNEPNIHVPALVEGKMKVVTEKTPWKPGIVAVNNFGFGGSNASLVLKANQEDSPERKERIIPRLALVCGRSEMGVQHVFNKIKEDEFTDESLLLLEEACKAPTLGMRFRGYALVQKPGEELTPVIASAPIDRLPVWFLFSGMGSQWSGMARDLMKLDVFANSIKLSAQVLKPYGVDLIHLLTEATEQELNHIVAPFVTIAAVQIALVDVVRSLGIEPDGIVGHSVGELGCAYADGCFTAEQMLMAAYWRGTSCTKCKLIHGAMAAVGMTWEETKRRCPEGVYPVCHNSEDSVTISGPAEKVHQFVKDLNSENIFARGVKTCDIAFHSKYVEPASHIMRKELTKVISNPLPRSSRWISSSVPESQWGEPHAQLSSVDYHVNNLLSPVLFNEAMSKLPKNALIIEFAPHSLLQAIVKRILGPDAVYIGLMKRQHEDNLLHCLNGIGKMYTSGLNPSAKNLYSPISYPVPRGTAMLNSLIKWNHDAQVYTWSYDQGRIQKNVIKNDTFRGSQYEFLTGHKVNGRILYPFMGYVYLAWQALAKDLQLSMNEVPVIIEDFSVYIAAMLPKTDIYTFQVKFLSCDGNFRISDASDSIIASGRVRRGDGNILKISKEMMDNINNTEKEEEEVCCLDSSDFYKELRLRGYEYGPTFQGVVRAHSSGVSGKVKWEGQWVSFMDAMLQIPILGVPLRALLLPTRVKSIRIDPTKKPQKYGEEIDMQFNRNINICRAGPVEIQGLHCGIAPKKVDYQSCPVLEESVFIPNYDYNVLTKDEIGTSEEYANACSTLAYNILALEKKCDKEISSFFNVYKDKATSKNVIEKLLKKDDKKYVLLKILKEIFDSNCPEKGLKETVQDALSKHSADLGQDMMGSQILNERALRASLDVVQDNQFSPTMKILELSAESVIHKDILKMLNTTALGLMKYEYTVAKINEKLFPEGVLESGVKKVTVDCINGDLPANNDLLVAKDIFTSCSCNVKEVLPAMITSLKSKGFILLIERTRLSPAEKFLELVSENKKHEQSEILLEKEFQAAGLNIICKKKDQMTSVVYLLRKRDTVTEDDPQPIVISVSDDNKYSWVDDLKASLKENEEKKLNRAIWLAADDPGSGIIGFVNCLKQEPGGKWIRCFFDCNSSVSEIGQKFQINNSKYKEIILNDLLFNVLKDGCWGMFRHRLLNSDPDSRPKKYSFLNVPKRGDLSSIKWIQNPDPKLDSNTNLVPVEIYYTALNFRDIMLASGKLPPDAIPRDLALQECILGMEFVGRDTNGRRVMGIAKAKALATHIVVPEDWLMEIPESWSMLEASTVAVVYMTSYYALLYRGRMSSGESVLIHSGTGGVGQAAISICLSMGCQVFVTVGSDEKKEFLKTLFPELNERQIYNSRDAMFEIQILNATMGKGVDLVLNSLADDKLQASVRCLKTHGRFLEIGKYDIAMNSNLGMANFSKNITFHAVFLDLVWEDRNQHVLAELKDMMMDGVKRGVVRPLKTNVFNWDQAEEAFRFMASGKHMGKVVLKIREEEEKQKNSISHSILIPSIPRTYCDVDKTYIVTGAFGGFGFELASWLVERGSRKIVLSARSPVKNEYQKLWIQRWKKSGTRVLISNEDLSTYEGCKKLLKKANIMGPVGGIFHLAMVLKDGLFENLTKEDFEMVSLPKVQGVRNLDRLSREMCPELDYFVVFSSISCGRGNPGQSNYGYANSVMERVVEQRKELGLPGFAIQWGGIGDVGVVYEKMGSNEVILKGTVPQRLISCLEVLDRFMQEGKAVVSSFVPVEKAAFFTDTNEDVVALLCKVLGVKDPSSVKPEMTLGELGMDSLMGVEIKQVLETEYDTVLTVPEVRQLSIKELEEIGQKKKSTSSSEELRSGKDKKVFLIAEMHLPTSTLIPMNESTDARCVFLVHPVEGHVKMLDLLARNLKCKVYGLQFTEDVPCGTVQEIAAYYVQKIKTTQPEGPYRLIGISYGTLICFEMAVLLQTRNEDVECCICIDGSPKLIKETCEKYMKKCGNHKLQYNQEAITIFLRHYVANLPLSVENLILNTPYEEDADHQLKRHLESLLGKNFDMELVLRIGDIVFKLCRASNVYESSARYKGKMTLIKAIGGTRPVQVDTMNEEDYGLGEVVDGDVELFSVESDHKSIGLDFSQDVSKIINDRIYYL